MNDTLLEHVLEKRVCFIEDEVWDKLGLPRAEVTKAKEGEQSNE